MTRVRTLALVLAGGKGSRLQHLTVHRARRRVVRLQGAHVAPVGPARGPARRPARRPGLSPSTLVSGAVERSVPSPGVVVEPGAVVRGSVLLHDVRGRRGAVVERAVLDAGVDVTEDARVGGDDGLVLVAPGERVSGRLEPGARQPRV